MRSSVEKVFGRVQHALGFGRTSTPPNDAGAVQTVQIELYGRAGDPVHQTRDNTPVVFHFGFAACLPVGTDVVVTTFSGDSSNGAIVASNHAKSRPTGLKPGQAMLYDQKGSQVLLSNDGDASVTATGTLTLAVPTVLIDGQLLVTGNVTAGSGGASVEVLNHAHQRSGGPGPGGPPIAGS